MKRSRCEVIHLMTVLYLRLVPGDLEASIARLAFLVACMIPNNDINFRLEYEKSYRRSRENFESMTLLVA